MAGLERMSSTSAAGVSIITLPPGKSARAYLGWNAMAAAGDVRILRFGMPRGGPRLARHLWRMCFALFIAAGSFFSIRERVAKVLPEPFTSGQMRALPILLLFGAMFYWLWRVRARRTLPVLVRQDSMPLTTPAE